MNAWIGPHTIYVLRNPSCCLINELPPSVYQWHRIQLLLCAHAMCFIAAYEISTSWTIEEKKGNIFPKMNATNAITMQAQPIDWRWNSCDFVPLLLTWSIRVWTLILYQVFDVRGICIRNTRIAFDRWRFHYVSMVWVIGSSMRYRLLCVILEQAPEAAKKGQFTKDTHVKELKTLAINFRKNYELRGCWNTNMLLNVVPTTSITHIQTRNRNFPTDKHNVIACAFISNFIISQPENKAQDWILFWV